MNDKLLIGSHCSMSSPDFYLGTVKEAISYNATTFMFYTGAPQSSYRKPLDECKINEGINLLKENNFDLDKIVVHAPYIVNLANDVDKEKYNHAISFMKEEVRRTATFKATRLVLHPGSHLGLGSEKGCLILASAINEILKDDKSDVKIAIETMSGKGNEIGITFEEIKLILDNVDKKDRVGVCLDTCHISDFGYDVFDADEILNEFDKVIGLNKLLVVHVNDSKNIRGSHKDRHENIGYGEIGFDALNAIVNHPLLVNIPKILETPYVNGVAPYKKEIEMFKNSKFVPNWRD